VVVRCIGIFFMLKAKICEINLRHAVSVLALDVLTYVSLYGE